MNPDLNLKNALKIKNSNPLIIPDLITISENEDHWYNVAEILLNYIKNENKALYWKIKSVEAFVNSELEWHFERKIDELLIKVKTPHR